MSAAAQAPPPFYVVKGDHIYYLDEHGRIGSVWLDGACIASVVVSR